MRISDDRYRREQSAFALTLGFIRHGVRTAIIQRWTGITPNRIRAIYDTYVRAEGIERPRGQSPSKAEYLLNRPRQRQEAAAWAFICQRMRVLPPERTPDPEKTLPGIERGELLLKAFEMFKCDLPHAHLTLDQAVLLLMALARRDEIRLGRCGSCGGMTLVDHFPHARPTCVYCSAGIEQTTAPRSQTGSPPPANPS